VASPSFAARIMLSGIDVLRSMCAEAGAPRTRYAFVLISSGGTPMSS